MMRHTLRRSERDGTYHVGYYNIKTERWESLLECTTLEDAAAYVSYLNGGSRPATPTPTLVLP